MMNASSNNANRAPVDTAAVAAAAAKKSQGKATLIEELGKRGLPTHGNELQLLMRLEDALEQEATEAITKEEQISDSKSVKIRRAIKWENEQAEMKVKEAEDEVKRKRGLLPPKKREVKELENMSPEDQAFERDSMTREDANSHRIERFYRNQLLREKDAAELMAALNELQGKLNSEEFLLIRAAIEQAIGEAQEAALEAFKRGEPIPPPVVPKPAANGAQAGAAASATDAQGNTLLQAMTGLSAERLQEGLRITKERERIAMEERKKQQAEKEPDLDLRQLFTQLNIDLKRSRTAKLAILRACSVVSSLQLKNEQYGYGLETSDFNPELQHPESRESSTVTPSTLARVDATVRLLAVGARRLISHCNELRTKLKGVTRRWTRARTRVAAVEADIVIETSRLLVTKK